MQQKNNEVQKASNDPFLSRLRHLNWLVRKRAYEQFLLVAVKAKSTAEEFNINGQVFIVGKFINILNNLVEEKHPNVLLKGLQCAEAILKMDSRTGKQFNKLVIEGLQKFPLLTQQRKQVLEKFLEIIELSKIDAGTLSNRLDLPQQKSLMFVIEVIGALQMSSLRGKLIEISKRHAKKEVRQLAAEIAGQIGEGISEQIEKQQVKIKSTSSRGVPQKKIQPKRVLNLIEKLPQFQQLNAKQQQAYSQELLNQIDELSSLPASGNVTSLCYFIQLMIESNNQIISMNGIKMLTALVRNKSAILNTSYPLLFFFRKFKTHKTHATNYNLLLLVQALLCSSRSNDLLNAINQGLGIQQNKANLKYGCIISFIRIFCYFYGHQQLFAAYCIGQYADLSNKIQNRKYVEKMIGKCFDVFIKQNSKDKQYLLAIEEMKGVLGSYLSLSSTNQKSNKQITKKQLSITNQTKAPIQTQTIKSTTPSHPSKQKLSATTKISSKSSLLVSPQGELNKILEIIEANPSNQAGIMKGINRCLECTKANLQENVFDLFYFCEIAQTFLDQYKPNELTDQIISHFLIDYIKILSTTEFKSTKKNSRIAQSGLEHLLKLSTCKLVLSKELTKILSDLLKNYSFQLMIKCLGKLYVTGNNNLKKKNKKYLTRWLQANASEECINSEYFELIEALQNNQERAKERNLNEQNQNQYQERQQIAVIVRKKQTQKLPTPKQQIKPVLIKKDLYQQQEQYKQINSRGDLEKLHILQNADVSKIEHVQQPSTDRIDEKWDYFLNKKGVHESNILYQQQRKTQLVESSEEQEKYTLNNAYKKKVQIKVKLKQSNEKRKDEYQDRRQYYVSQQHDQQEDQIQFKKIQGTYNVNEKQSDQDSFYRQKRDLDQDHSNDQGDQQIKNHVQQQQNHQQQFQFKYLKYENIKYMAKSSANPFNHLKGLIITPFKSQPKKHEFLRQLTFIIQSLQLTKPQPFNSILLVIILLFTEIKSDKTIIEPLQFLYEYMAQRCTNNEFLKIIISFYSSVIEQTEQNERRLLLTILTKSMTRIMPFVQDPVQLLKDFQQFYQIGEIVYFQMAPDDYNSIKQVIENSDSLFEVIQKAYQKEGQNLIAIVQGWLETGFKRLIKEALQTASDHEEIDF